MVQRYCAELKKLKSTELKRTKGEFRSPQVWRIIDLEEYDSSVTEFLRFSREARNLDFKSNMKSACL